MIQMIRLELVKNMDDEILGEVRLLITEKSPQLRVITHKDGLSVEVDIEGMKWTPGEKYIIHFENLTVRLVPTKKED